MDDKGGEEFRVTDSQVSGLVKLDVQWCHELRCKTREEKPSVRTWEVCICFVQRHQWALHVEVFIAEVCSLGESFI